jgi:mannitol/fructose-specific phosphotransferase system IIA component (Ntr-type)
MNILYLMESCPEGKDLKITADKKSVCFEVSRRGDIQLNISRFLKPELIKLEMETNIEFEPDKEVHPQKRLWMVKEAILKELVGLLENSGKVCNKNKLFLDLLNREKKATTGIGKSIAIPHVRTIQVRDFVIGFARSKEGYEFDSMDGKPVHLFFIMAAPPYDDTLYLKVFKALAELLHSDSFSKELFSASSEYEIIRAIRNLE